MKCRSSSRRVRLPGLSRREQIDAKTIVAVEAQAYEVAEARTIETAKDNFTKLTDVAAI